MIDWAAGVLYGLTWQNWVVVAAVAALLLGVIGHCLPRWRVITRRTDIALPPHRLFALLADPALQSKWRRDLAGVVIDGESWRERRPGGDIWRFRLVENQPFIRLTQSFLSTQGQSGLRDLRLSPLPDGGTRLELEERILTPSPFRRLWSALLDDPAALVDQYVADLIEAARWWR